MGTLRVEVSERRNIFYLATQDFVMSEALNPFDLFVLVVLVLATFWGGVRGIISQLTSIFSWLASAYIATHYYFIVAKFMNSSYAHYKPLAMIVTFIVSALLIRIASNIVKNMVSLAGLKEFDRQMGAALGFVKGALLCLLVTFAFVVFGASTRSVVENSKTGPYLTAFISQIQIHLPESELTRRFVDYAGTIEQKSIEEDDGTKSKSITTEVRDLKKYLVSKVLSDAASDIVAEAEEGDVNGSEDAISSLFQTATSTVNRLKDSVSQSFSNDSTMRPSVESNPSWDAGFDRYGYGRLETHEEPRIESRSAIDSSPDYAWNDPRANPVPIASPMPIASAPEISEDQNSGDDWTGLAAFFNSIGGGYGSRNNSNADIDWTPQNRSGNFRSNDSNASHSRLNSRSYTIEPSSVSY